jgi:hypothetical protein
LAWARLKMSVICSYSEGNLLFLLNFGDRKDEFSRAVVWDAIQLLLKPKTSWKWCGSWNGSQAYGLYMFLKRVWDLSDELSKSKTGKSAMARTIFGHRNFKQDLEQIVVSCRHGGSNNFGSAVQLLSYKHDTFLVESTTVLGSCLTTAKMLMTSESMS